jgi:hypothetical protein
VAPLLPLSLAIGRVKHVIFSKAFSIKKRIVLSVAITGKKLAILAQ